MHACMHSQACPSMLCASVQLLHSNNFVCHGSSNHVLIDFDVFQYFFIIVYTSHNYDEIVMEYIILRYQKSYSV